MGPINPYCLHNKVVDLGDGRYECLEYGCGVVFTERALVPTWARPAPSIPNFQEREAEREAASRTRKVGRRA